MNYKSTTTVLKLRKLQARTRIVRGGTSAGKTICILLILIDYAIKNPNKIKFYKKDKYDPAEVDSINKNNQYYKKILTVNSEYNRLFLFDSHHYHMAESFVDENDKSDRLTLISFISNLKSLDNKILKYGLPESKRLD